MHKREIVKEHFRNNYRSYLLPSVRKLMGKEFAASFDKFYSKNKLKNWLKGGNFKNPSNLRDQLSLIEDKILIRSNQGSLKTMTLDEVMKEGGTQPVQTYLV